MRAPSRRPCSPRSCALLHDELAVAASDNVSLADALEKQRRSEREAQSKLSNALSPDKRPPQDEDLAVFAQRVAEALRRAKDELAAQRSAGEDLAQARALADEASRALRNPQGAEPARF